MAINYMFMPQKMKDSIEFSDKIHSCSFVRFLMVRSHDKAINTSLWWFQICIALGSE